MKSVAPKVKGFWARAAPQDATRSGDLHRPRELQVFNSGSCISLLFQIVQYGCFGLNLLPTTPKFKTLIFQRGCSPADSSAPWNAARPGLVAPRVAVPPIFCTLEAAPTTPSVGDNATSPLQWLRDLITMFHFLNCNQVAKPLQSFGGAASKCSGLGARPP